MKKVLILLACAAAIVACSKEEPIAINQGQAISFSNPFINKVTRAIDHSYKAMPNTFKVYGTAQFGSAEPTTIFDGVDVNYSAVTSTYAPAAANTQYWVEGGTYNFKAVVGSTIDNNNKIAYDDDTTDILFAKNDTPIVYAKGDPTTVELTFNHILSKAQFTFKNTISNNADYTYKVEDVKISNIYTAGTYDAAAADGSWTTSGEANGSALFGHVSDAIAAGSEDAIEVGNGASATSNHSLLLIPAAYTNLTISCTIKTYYDDVLINTENFSKSNFAHTFVKGCAYNFVITRGLNEITFSVNQLVGWNPNTNGTDVTVQ